MPRHSSMLLAALLALFTGESAFAKSVLIFSKVQDGAYRHTSIPLGIKALQAIGKERGWQVDVTDDAAVFNDKSLKKYAVIVWNNTGGVVLNDRERRAFQTFIHHGGGYAGIHMAAAGSFVDGGSTCTEPGWPWFETLVGARFKFHEAPRAAKLSKNPAEHIALDRLPDPWYREDEWYEWESDPAADANVKVLLWVDESSYSTMGKTGRHPVSWYKEFEGGRVFYTAMGHTDASFKDANFRRHLAGGIEWAGRLDAARATQ